MRAAVIITADSAGDAEALGRIIDVEVESVTVCVDGELLQRELRPLLIEHVSIFVAEKRDERKGPLVHIHVAPQEDNRDTNNDGTAEGDQQRGE